MKLKYLIHATLILCFLLQSSYSTEKADIIVAKDGTGKFTSIQAALNSIPDTNSSNKTILIKKGVYNEHIFISKSFISLIGESREQTRIELNLDREKYKSARGSTINNGSGVIDIGISITDTLTAIPVSDILIGNLTVVNTAPGLDVYSHAIRGENKCTRIYVVHCNVWTEGKDVLGLWSPVIGMYYHTDCSFKGNIDAVCPRGWCYAVNCEFQETYVSAPIWHEGADTSTTQKFVIRTSSFRASDGSTSKFKLMNGQKKSRFYILDALFTPAVTSAGPASEAYFYNCKGGTGSWFGNNLPASLNQAQITAKWTFDNSWDAENLMPSALPYASIPQPWTGAYDLPSSVTLKWIKGRNATQNAIYFGTTNPPPLIKTQSENFHTLSNLSKGTFYWRVDAIDGTDTVKGNTWSFAVGQGLATQTMRTSVNPSNFFTISSSGRGKLFVTFEVERKSAATINIYNLQGKQLYNHFLGVKKSGTHNQTLDISNLILPAGKYIAYLNIGDQIETTEFTLQ